MATPKRIVLAWITAAFFVVLAATAPARQVAGVNMPDRMQVAGKTLVLNGMGIRKATFLKVKVYVAGLYLEARSKDAATIIRSTQQKRLVLQFTRDVTRDQITEAWTEGFTKNAGKALPSLKPRIAQLNGWMPNLRERDSLTFTYVPATGVEVRVNGAVKGTIPGDDFARALWSIWLGNEPPNEDLKTGLLGLD